MIDSGVGSTYESKESRRNWRRSPDGAFSCHEEERMGRKYGAGATTYRKRQRAEMATTISGITISCIVSALSPKICYEPGWNRPSFDILAGGIGAPIKAGPGQALDPDGDLRSPGIDPRDWKGSRTSHWGGETGKADPFGLEHPLRPPTPTLGLLSMWK